MPTTDEILQEISDRLADIAGREVTVSLNGGKVMYSVHGRSILTSDAPGGMGSPFEWQIETIETEAPPTGNILQIPFRSAPFELVIPTSLMSTTTGPITIKDISGQGGIYPITITGEGAEPFDGESSMVINTAYGCIGIYPWGGAWHVLWFYGG